MSKKKGETGGAENLQGGAPPESGQPDAGKRRIRRLGAAFLIAVVALCIAIFVLNSNLTARYSPDTAVQQYADDLRSGSWSAAYSLVNFPASDFINAGAYSAVMSSSLSDPDVYVTKIVQSASYTASLISGSRESGTVVYRVMLDGGEYIDLTLVNTGTIFYFYEDWKIDAAASGICLGSYTLEVPNLPEAQLSVNGVGVSGSCLAAKSSGTDTPTHGYTSAQYILEGMLVGKNTFTLTSPAIADSTQALSVSAEAPKGRLDEVTPTQNTLDTLTALARSDLQAIIGSEISGGTFQSVSGLFDPVYAPYFSSQFGNPGGLTTFTLLRTYLVDPGGIPYGKGGGISIHLAYYASYTAGSVFYPSSGELYASFIFSYLNGGWVISDMSLT